MHAVQIKKVIKELSRAKRPIICAGGGVHLSNSADELYEFAHKYNIPVVSTLMGISVMPTEDPLYYGMVGNNGKSYANKAMNESDLLIMIGARVADRAVAQPDLITENKILIHIDIDPAEIGKNVGPSIPLVGDVEAIISDLTKEELNVDYSDWINTLNEYKKSFVPRKAPREGFVDPAKFITELSRQMDDNAIYVADVGQNQMWSCNFHIVKHGRFLTSGGMGTMGYSIPAAMGAKKALPDRQVVAVCGDGSFQMSMMELATMQQHKIPFKIVVFHNGYLGLVREYQQNTYKGNYSVVDLTGSPDLSKLSAAYDIPFIRLENCDDMEDKINTFLHCDGPMMMECILDPMDVVK